MSPAHPKKVRIPVSFVDGYLELRIGGALPLRNGANIDVTVQRDLIEDPWFLEILTQRRRFKALPEGTQLIALFSGVVGGLTVEFPDFYEKYDNIRGRIQQQLSSRWSVDHPTFVGLEIGPSIISRSGSAGDDDGGLWLKTEGLNAIGLEASSVLLPEEFHDEPVRSLNHALTILSEKIESDRISHTCNAYEQVYYQEANGYWYPLNWLRDEALQAAEHRIASELWEKFRAETSLLLRGARP